MGHAYIKHPVIYARAGAYLEPAAVGLTVLHGQDIAFARNHAPIVKRHAIRVSPQMMQHLIDAGSKIEHRTGAARALASLHGVDGNGRVKAERDCLHIELPVAATHVNAANWRGKKLVNGTEDLT